MHAFRFSPSAYYNYGFNPYSRILEVDPRLIWSDYGDRQAMRSPPCHCHKHSSSFPCNFCIMVPIINKTQFCEWPFERKVMCKIQVYICQWCWSYINPTAGIGVSIFISRLSTSKLLKSSIHVHIEIFYFSLGHVSMWLQLSIAYRRTCFHYVSLDKPNCWYGRYKIEHFISF